MNLKASFFIAAMTLMVLVLAPVAQAVEGNRFHLDAGLAYTSGAIRIDNKLKDAYQSEGFDYDSTVVPLGLKLDPYYLFGNGLGVGASFGPTDAGTVRNSAFFRRDDDYFAVLPIGLDARYEFINRAGIDPYIRGGVRFPITFGNLVDDGRPGFLAAAGMVFPRLHLGFEAAYDSSTINVHHDNFAGRVHPNEFMFTLFFHF